MIIETRERGIESLRARGSSRVGQGAEFASNAFDYLPNTDTVAHDFSCQGKPTDSAPSEPSAGELRGESPNAGWFLNFWRPIVPSATNDDGAFSEAAWVRSHLPEEGGGFPARQVQCGGRFCVRRRCPIRWTVLGAGLPGSSPSHSRDNPSA